MSRCPPLAKAIAPEKTRNPLSDAPAFSSYQTSCWERRRWGAGFRARCRQLSWKQTPLCSTPPSSNATPPALLSSRCRAERSFCLMPDQKERRQCKQSQRSGWRDDLMNAGEERRGEAGAALSKPDVLR